MQVKLDQSGCIGCGLCAGTCPAVFAMTDGGTAVVIAAPTEETLSPAREAAENCPAAVIQIND